MTYGPSQDSGPTPETAEKEHQSCQLRDISPYPPAIDHCFPDSRLPNLAQIYSQEELLPTDSPNTKVLVELRSHGISKAKASEVLLDASKLPWLKFVAQLTTLEARAHYAQLLDRQERKNLRELTIALIQGQ